VTDQPQPITVYDPEGSPVSVGGRTVDDQAARVAELAAEWANRHGLEAFVVKFRDTLDTMLTNHWAFLDAFSDRQWPGQDTPPGGGWPTIPADPDPTSLAQAIPWVNRKMAVVDQRQQILRAQLSFVTFAQTREARLLDLLLAVLGEVIERDPTLIPPPDR
jgi:hypothetical protein